MPQADPQRILADADAKALPPYTEYNVENLPGQNQDQKVCNRSAFMSSGCVFDAGLT